VTEAWTPAPGDEEPAGHASACFCFTLDVNLDEGRIVGLSDKYGPSTDFRYGATMRVLDMFPPDVVQDAQEVRSDG
jgi:hypothetical protein